MTTKPQGKVDKGWGFEIVWANNDNYAGKILVFERAGAKSSMHFHKTKDKTWFINEGSFKVIYCDTTAASYHEKILETGAVWHNPPMMIHQLIALQDNSIIFEVSTPDTVEDNYRIAPGDSQSATTEQPSA